jgi:hypothetical protein
MIKNIENYYFNIIIIIICLSLTHQNGIIFTDYAYNNQSSYQIKRVQINLTNCSYLNVVDINTQLIIPLTASTTSIINSLNSNYNYTINSFEFQSNYFSFSRLNELFCNQIIINSSIASNKRVISTHTTFDCDEYVINTNINSNIIPDKQIICLSTSVNQIFSVVKSFLENYNFIYYSIIYSNINLKNYKYLDYYTNLANNLVYKLAFSSFKLDFIITINNTLLFDKLTNSKATGNFI